MIQIETVIYSFILGGLGGVIRFSTDDIITKYNKSKFPISTFVINTVGVILLSISQFILPANYLKFAFFFFGGFTTFSKFNLELIRLVQSNNSKTAIKYFSLSYFLPIVISGVINYAI